MIGKKRFIYCLVFIVFALGAVVFASESDANLCFTEWAGQCQTQRQWEAGWCYANMAQATCAALYPDITMQANGQNASGGNASSASANVAGHSAGNQNSGLQPVTSGLQTVSGKKPPAQATPTQPACPSDSDCSTDPPTKPSPTPKPPTDHAPPFGPQPCPKDSKGFICWG